MQPSWFSISRNACHLGRSFLPPAACLPILLILVLFHQHGLTRADDWFRWRGPNLSGISTESNWVSSWSAEGPKQLWKAEVGVGFSSIAASQGRVYTLGNAANQDSVICFDAEQGTVLWKYSYPCGLRPQYYEGGTSSTPTIDGDRAYTLGKEGQLFCLEAATGKVLWQKKLVEELGLPMPRWGFAGSPLVQGDRLLLNAGTAGLALQKESGQVAWQSAKGAAGYASPVPITLLGQSCVLFFAAKALVCVRVADGHELWRYPCETHWDLNVADPIVVGDRIFISTFDRGAALLKVDGGNATEIWRNSDMANHFNSCVLFHGFLYGVHGNTDKPPAELRCMDLESGAVRWKFGGLGFGGLTLAGGKLIVLSDRGELVVAPANPTGFQPIARAQVLGGKCWITPVLSDGRIYCRNAHGTLLCLDVRAQ